MSTAEGALTDVLVIESGMGALLPRSSFTTDAATPLGQSAGLLGSGYVVRAEFGTSSSRDVAIAVMCRVVGSRASSSF